MATNKPRSRQDIEEAIFWTKENIRSKQNWRATAQPTNSDIHIERVRESLEKEAEDRQELTNLEAELSKRIRYDNNPGLEMEDEYNDLIKEKSSAYNSASDFQSLASQFRRMGNYNDATALSEECQRIANQKKIEIFLQLAMPSGFLSFCKIIWKSGGGYAILVIRVMKRFINTDNKQHDPTIKTEAKMQ